MVEQNFCINDIFCKYIHKTILYVHLKTKSYQKGGAATKCKFQ